MPIPTIAARRQNKIWAKAWAMKMSPSDSDKREKSSSAGDRGVRVRLAMPKLKAMIDNIIPEDKWPMVRYFSKLPERALRNKTGW